MKSEWLKEGGDLEPLMCRGWMALKSWSFHAHLLSAEITVWATTAGLEDFILKANTTFSLVTQALVIESISSGVINSVQRHQSCGFSLPTYLSSVAPFPSPLSLCSLHCSKAVLIPLPHQVTIHPADKTPFLTSKPHHTNLSCRPSAILLIADF